MAPENIVKDNSGGSSSSLMAPENIVNDNSGRSSSSLLAPENIVNDNSGGSSSLMAPENKVNDNSGGFHFIYHHSHFDFAYSLLPTSISPTVKYDFIPLSPKQKKNFFFVLFGLTYLIST